MKTAHRKAAKHKREQREARGVPLHDIASRLQRLLREASEIDANRP